MAVRDNPIMTRLTVALYALLAVILHSQAAMAEMSVITPPDRSVVTGEQLVLVLSLDGTRLGAVDIFVNNRRQKTVAVPQNKNVVCIDGITLSTGYNSIKAVTTYEKKKVGELNLTVLLSTPLSPTWDSPPEGFKAYLFHGSANTKVCAPCHTIDFSTASDAAETGEKSPCYVCHKKLLSPYPVAHGPAAVWSCLTCHTSSPKKGKAGALTANKRVCVECHDQPMSLWQSKKYIHGPLVDGDCVTCHNPHASDFRSLLRLSAYDLCTSCHDQILLTPHVISGFSERKGHPLRLPRDPLKPGSEFSCISCHNPHAGDSPFFLAHYKLETRDEYCRTCHFF